MKKTTCPRGGAWCAAVSIVLCTILAPVWAQPKNGPPSGPKGDPSLLSVERIFSSKEFDLDKAPSIRWRKPGAGYVTLEPAGGGQQLVAHDPATGRREVLVPDHCSSRPARTGRSPSKGTISRRTALAS